MKSLGNHAHVDVSGHTYAHAHAHAMPMHMWVMSMLSQDSPGLNLVALQGSWDDSCSKQIAPEAKIATVMTQPPENPENPENILTNLGFAWSCMTFLDF